MGHSWAVTVHPALQVHNSSLLPLCLCYRAPAAASFPPAEQQQQQQQQWLLQPCSHEQVRCWLAPAAIMRVPAGVQLQQPHLALGFKYAASQQAWQIVGVCWEDLELAFVDSDTGLGLVRSPSGRTAGSCHRGLPGVLRARHGAAGHERARRTASLAWQRQRLEFSPCLDTRLPRAGELDLH